MTHNRPGADPDPDPGPESNPSRESNATSGAGAQPRTQPPAPDPAESAGTTAAAAGKAASGSAPGADGCARIDPPDRSPEARAVAGGKGLFGSARKRGRVAMARKSRQVSRISRTSLRYGAFMCGAGFVALFSMAFAWIAETALHWNTRLTQATPWLAFVMLPFGLAGLRWLTIRLAPQARGSGIPQVIAACTLPPAGPEQGRLVSLRQAAWKVLLTAGALLAGASVGREGPSVQVGAAAMLSWGRWCQERLRFRIGFHPNALIAAGAAGGLASAFNTPLAGVVFAIEELGRGTAVRWDRLVLSGVLTSGFLTLALLGNNPYFVVHTPILALSDAWGAVLLCALATGVLGGLFAKALIGGMPSLLPARWREWPRAHPVWLAFLCGLVVALLGWATGGATYGTGYEVTADLINGVSTASVWFGISKLVATIASYFAGIPGGIFTPALAIGAGIGENVAQLLGNVSEPRLLALVAMAAFLAGATQAPVTATVIVMEMTRSQDLTLFLLAATLLASFVSRQFCPHPFYHAAAHAFRREVSSAGRHG